MLEKSIGAAKDKKAASFFLGVFQSCQSTLQRGLAVVTVTCCKGAERQGVLAVCYWPPAQGQRDAAWRALTGDPAHIAECLLP